MKKIIGVTQRVDFVEAYGERRDCLDQKWSFFLKEIDCIGIPLMNGLSLAELTELHQRIGFDGFILTGGNDVVGCQNSTNIAPERDAFEYELIRFSQKRGIPILGVCRGAQFIGSFYGNKLVNVKQHVGKHEIVIEKDFCKEQLREVNSYHNYGFLLEDFGDKLDVFAYARDNVIEGFFCKEHSIYGIMWHPEREEPFQKFDLEFGMKIFAKEIGK